MVVDPKRKIAFIHNPKAAGTSVRTALLNALQCEDVFRYQGFIYSHERQSMQMHNMSHLDWHTFQLVLRSDPRKWGDPESYRYFGVVRDPYERLKSAVREFHVKHRHWIDRLNGGQTISFLLDMLTPESVWLPEFSWFKPQHVFFPKSGNFDLTVALLSRDHRSLQEVWDANFDVPVEFGHLNKKVTDEEDPALPFSRYEQELRSLTRYLYADDYRLLANLFDYPVDSTPVRFHNTASYMWAVRGIQTHKVDPETPVAKPYQCYHPYIASQIQETPPFILDSK